MLKHIKKALVCPACGAIAPARKKTRIPIQAARWVCGPRCYGDMFFDAGLQEELDIEALELSAGALPPGLKLDAKKEGPTSGPSPDFGSML